MSVDRHRKCWSLMACAAPGADPGVVDGALIGAVGQGFGLGSGGVGSGGRVWAFLRLLAGLPRGIGRADFAGLGALGVVGEDVAAAAEPPGGAVDGEDLGVVQQAVEDRDG